MGNTESGLLHEPHARTFGTDSAIICCLLLIFSIAARRLGVLSFFGNRVVDIAIPKIEASWSCPLYVMVLPIYVLKDRLSASPFWISRFAA